MLRLTVKVALALVLTAVLVVGPVFVGARYGLPQGTPSVTTTRADLDWPTPWPGLIPDDVPAPDSVAAMSSALLTVRMAEWSVAAPEAGREQPLTRLGVGAWREGYGRLYGFTMTATLAGWPLGAFGWQRHTSAWSVRSAFVMDEFGVLRLHRPFRNPVDVPTRPIWPGLIVNTLLMGVVSTALVFGPGVVRRRRRIAQGRCLACGYDLRGGPAGEATCPECGGALPMRGRGTSGDEA